MSPTNEQSDGDAESRPHAGGITEHPDDQPASAGSIESLESSSGVREPGTPPVPNEPSSASGATVSQRLSAGAPPAPTTTNALSNDYLSQPLIPGRAPMVSAPTSPAPQSVISPPAEPPASSETQAVERTSPRHTRASNVPTGLEHASGNSPTDAAQFVEAGRSAASGTFAQQAPPHLDDRLAGLEETPTPRRNRWGFGRKVDSLPPNEGTIDSLDVPVTSPLRISVVGMKGGVGKTTLALLMAKSIARHKAVPVLLLDSDTTYGSLMLRTGLAPLACAPDIAQLGDPGNLDVLTGMVSKTEDGVWVLPSGRNPAQSAALNENTYMATVRAVYRHFPITVTDCGACMAGSMMNRVITASHTLVIATAPSIDSVLATYNALEWLSAIGFGDLAKRSVVAISNVDPHRLNIDIVETKARFATLCRSVITIPTDPALSPGSVLDYDQLNDQTTGAARILAATAVDSALSAC